MLLFDFFLSSERQFLYPQVLEVAKVFPQISAVQPIFYV